MSKHTQSNLMPVTLRRNLETMGAQLKLARKRRRLPIAAIADRAQCSELTVIRAERGTPTVSMGVYARILHALGLDDDLLLIAGADPVGNAMVNARLMNRNQRKTDDDEDYDVFD